MALCDGRRCEKRASERRKNTFYYVEQEVRGRCLPFATRALRVSCYISGTWAHFRLGIPEHWCTTVRNSTVVFPKFVMHSTWTHNNHLSATTISTTLSSACCAVTVQKVAQFKIVYSEIYSSLASSSLLFATRNTSISLVSAFSSLDPRVRSPL